MLLKIGKILHGMQKDQKEKKGEEGFTLIELLVVVIIIGILAAIAIPVFLAQRERAQNASAESDTRNAATAITTWATGQPGGSFTGLEIDDVTANGGTLSPGNNWAEDEPTSTANSFTIGVTSQNGVTYTFRSNPPAGEAQLINDGD